MTKIVKMTKMAGKTFTANRSFLILSFQRGKLEKFKPFLHKNQQANSGENNTKPRKKRTLIEVKHHEKPQQTDLTSSPLHSAFDSQY